VTSKTLRTIALFVLKALVSGLLLTYVLRKMDLQNIAAHFREMDLRLFILSALLFLVNNFLAAFRWRLLLNNSMPAGKLFSLVLIGSFFNNLLPGSVGGDAVKAYYLYRDTQEGGKSIASVFLDRYVGFLALLTIGLISGLVAFKDLAAVGMQWITPLLFIAFLGGSLVVFGLRIGRRFATIAAFHDYFHDTIRNRPVILKTYLLSLVMQTIIIFMVYLIGRSIGYQLSFSALFVYLPIIFTVIMVPVSVSGLGLREGAFVLLFGLTGVPAEASATISFLWFLSIAAGSLVGLFEYFRRWRR
jgi:glycosyltransferase 2 family protein